jgi:hypothetical protein
MDMIAKQLGMTTYSDPYFLSIPNIVGELGNAGKSCE